MRFLFCFFLWAFAASLGQAAEVEFTRVWPGWRDAESFDRISEYFTDRENTGGHTLLRTHAETRAGYYFLVRLKSASVVPAGAKFVLSILSPASPEPKTHEFPVIAATTGVLELGLTGADWSDQKTHPVAWKLELLSADGRSLASTQSFLWAMPAP